LAGDSVTSLIRLEQTDQAGSKWVGSAHALQDIENIAGIRMLALA
jgi:hypothetical protein